MSRTLFWCLANLATGALNIGFGTPVNLVVGTVNFLVAGALFWAWRTA